jgi:hypothetical protein
MKIFFSLTMLYFKRIAISLLLLVVLSSCAIRSLKNNDLSVYLAYLRYIALLGKPSDVIDSVFQNVTSIKYEVLNYPSVGLHALVISDSDSGEQTIAILSSDDDFMVKIASTKKPVIDANLRININQLYKDMYNDIRIDILTRLSREYRINFVGYGIGGVMALLLASEANKANLQINNVISYGETKFTDYYGTREITKIKAKSIILFSLQSDGIVYTDIPNCRFINPKWRISIQDNGSIVEFEMNEFYRKKQNIDRSGAYHTLDKYYNTMLLLKTENGRYGGLY